MVAKGGEQHHRQEEFGYDLSKFSSGRNEATTSPELI